jgi:hypothetical protein
MLLLDDVVCGDQAGSAANGPWHGFRSLLAERSNTRDRCRRPIGLSQPPAGLMQIPEAAEATHDYSGGIAVVSLLLAFVLAEAGG